MPQGKCPAIKHKFFGSSFNSLTFCVFRVNTQRVKESKELIKECFSSNGTSFSQLFRRHQSTLPSHGSNVKFAEGATITK
jgi:hypothetical protein